MSLETPEEDSVDALGPTMDAVIEAQRALNDQSAASSRRRSEIVAIAAGLFAERGYRGTTIRDIGEHANILSGSLYHHFQSKETIIDEIVGAYMRDMFAEYERVLATEPAGAAQIRAMIGGSLRMLDTHGPAIRILQNDYAFIAEARPHLRPMLQVTERVWTDVLRVGRRHGLRHDLNPRLTYRSIVGAINETARWFNSSGTITMEQVISEMQHTFTHGIEGHSPSDRGEPA